MNKILTIALVLLLLSGCTQTHSTKDTSSGEAGTKAPEAVAVGAGWQDSIVQYYIAHTGKDMILESIKQNIKEKWLLDRSEKREGKTYDVFQVGHDVTDGGVSASRFMTDQWLYIDSISKQVYEYDLANDLLVKWP